MKKKGTANGRKAEEQRILAEMEKAMQETNTISQSPTLQIAAIDENSKPQPNAQPISARKSDDTMPEKIHCKRCKTLMENGVCPTCGFRIYMPMDEEKRKKIKLVLTAVGMAIFVVVFVVMQFIKK